MVEIAGGGRTREGEDGSMCYIILQQYLGEESSQKDQRKGVGGGRKEEGRGRRKKNRRMEGIP